MACVALMAAGGGYFAAMKLGTPRGAPSPPSLSVLTQPDDLLGQRRPDFSLADLGGAPVAASDFDGGIWLLNFWATWCAPCVDEMPMLAALHRNRESGGLPVVGIALDDPDTAREFVSALGVDYPILVGLTDTMLVGRRYGNRAGMLPYSVLIDGGGIIRWTHLGAVDRDQVLRQAEKLRQSN
jgi:peroxiredoxin